MNLFLQWWGSYPDTKEMDKLFFLWLDTNKKLMYIPTAMIGWFTYEECFWYVSNIVRDLWLDIEIDMFPYLDKLSDVDFSSYSWIYIWWGNTFHLLNEIKLNWIDKKLFEFINNWWNVCWWSAWAIIFWKDINSASDANIVWMKDTVWFNMLSWATLWCHYRDDHKNEIMKYVYNHKNIVIALTEKAWLLVDENWIKCIWEDKITVYTKDDYIVYNPWDNLKF
jgi:peptidase E